MKRNIAFIILLILLVVIELYWIHCLWMDVRPISPGEVYLPQSAPKGVRVAVDVGAMALAALIFTPVLRRIGKKKQ